MNYDERELAKTGNNRMGGENTNMLIPLDHWISQFFKFFVDVHKFEQLLGGKGATIEVLTNNDYEPKENEKVITETLKTFISVSATQFRGHFYKNVIK
jgi:hypothetical protein